MFLGMALNLMSLGGSNFASLKVCLEWQAERRFQASVARGKNKQGDHPGGHIEQELCMVQFRSVVMDFIIFHAFLIFAVHVLSFARKLKY